ncbi:YihY/virulence factor BrkB family protein [Bacillus massiliigorillae]|uniref:YihY/virulence factor BrkB family protein n=1 Tax=Bacillus massiliigorillae TaxID=1243664 RepID=UPI000399F228|nr:YihY/virulence factor BrkB family protein [Bacillus massiliigorillae]
MVKKNALTITRFIAKIIKRMQDHDVSGMAAQLAFFFLLSLFPLLLFLVTLLPYLPITAQDILDFLGTYVPESSMKIIESQVDNIMRGSGKLLSFGIIATLWSASNGMNAIHKAFNRAYNVEDTRTYLLSRAISIVLTIAMVFVFIVGLLLPVFGKQIGLFLFAHLDVNQNVQLIWDILRWSMSILILFCVFSILYLMVPFKKLHRRVAPGALFTTLGWSVVSWGFSYYVNNFANYTTTYGSIGGIIVLMLWFYLSAHIIIIGGELNAMASEKKISQ